MAYTPPDQEVHAEIEASVFSLERLLEKLQNRIDAPGEWNKEHRLECLNMKTKIANLIFELREL